MNRCRNFLWWIVTCALVPHAVFGAPATLSRVLLATTYSASTVPPGRLISVPAGGNFQETLNSAQPGDIVEIQAGAALGGDFLLPEKSRTAWLYIHAVDSMSSDSTANGNARVFTVAPPAPATAASADVAQATASQPDEVRRLMLYSRGQTVASDDIFRAPGSGPQGNDQGRRPAANDSWPMRGHNPANTGHTVALGPAVQAQPVWTFQPDAGTFVWRPAVASDGTIYVTTVSFPPSGVDGRLYALRPDGSVKWQAQLTNSSGLNVWASVTPVIDRDGNIYIAWAHDENFGSLTAISLDANGNVRWRFEPKIELESASHQQPVIANGVLYAGADTSFFFGDTTHRASLFALDVATGTPIWHWNSPNLDTFFDGPAVGHDGYIYHTSASNPVRGAAGYLYRIRPNGELDWSVNIGVGVNLAPPTIDAKNNIYVGNGDGVASKYSSAGVLLWTYDTLAGQIYTSPVLNGTRVSVGAAFAGLHVLDINTGTREALFAPTEYPFGQASDRAGNTFFYSLDVSGTVFGVGRGGRQWWAFNTGLGSSVNSVAIAEDGKLLVGNSQTLQAYVAPVLGDLNCDGAVNAFDIAPFILAITDPVKYAQRYPRCYPSLADVNGDGAVDSFDFAPFIRLLDRPSNPDA